MTGIKTVNFLTILDYLITFKIGRYTCYLFIKLVALNLKKPSSSRLKNT